VGDVGATGAERIGVARRQARPLGDPLLVARARRVFLYLPGWSHGRKILAAV